jgi:hypothetical protein
MPRTKKPLSPEKLAANRANAARSTGPRSPEGKARSAQNSRKHGFAAADFAVVRLEDLQDVANLRADLIASYQPVNSQELFAIERMALAQQAILRAARLESGFLTSCLNSAMSNEDRPFYPMDEALCGDLEVTRAQNRNYALAEGLQRIAHHTNSFSLFLRYQAQAERHYRRAVEELNRLIALRDVLPNEPTPDLEPEQNEPPSAPPNEPNPPPLPPERAPSQMAGVGVRATKPAPATLESVYRPRDSGGDLISGAATPKNAGG